MSDAVVANRRGWLILAADLVLFFLLLRWLPFSPTENRGLALLVFVGVLWLTEAFHITVTSLMIPLFAIGLGVLSTKAAFAPFAEPVIFMFFGGFVIAAVLHIQKLDLWIAGHVIRLAGGSLKLTIFYLFAVTAFLSLFVNNTAVAAMMLPLTLGILRQVDAEKNRMPVVALMMPAMVLSLWVVLRPNFNVPFNVDIEDIPLDGRRMFTLIVFAATAVLLILGKLVVGPLQQLLALPEPIKNIDSVIAMMAVVVMCVGGSASWKQIQEHTEWGVLMLFGGGLVLSIVMKDTGASKILADSIVAAVGHQHPVIIMLSLTAFVVFLTEFTSNTATAALLMPIFITVARTLQLPDIALASIIACGASCAFMLPIATPPNAIVYATGKIRLGEMVRVGLLLNIACILIIGLLAHGLWVHW